MVDTLCTCTKYNNNNVVQELSVIDSRSVLSFMRNALNCDWDAQQRELIIETLWTRIQEISINLLDDALISGNPFCLESLFQSITFFFCNAQETQKPCSRSWTHGEDCVIDLPINLLLYHDMHQHGSYL